MIFTYIARVTDGVLLVASMDSGGDQRIEKLKMDGKQLLKQLTQRSPARCTIEAGQHLFHYAIEGSVCTLTLTEQAYPKRLAFVFLDDLHKQFVQHVMADHGDRWEQHLLTIDRPYAFIKFDKVIQRLRKDYADPNSRQNMSKLNENLQDIQTIMKRNIQEVLNRGEKLDHVSQISSNLVTESKKFSWGAKKLNMMALYKKYAPAGIALLLLILFFWLRWYVL